MTKTTLLVAALATFVFTGSVFASDANTDWTGPYVGAYAGTNSNNATMADYWCDATCSQWAVVGALNIRIDLAIREIIQRTTRGARHQNP